MKTILGILAFTSMALIIFLLSGCSYKQECDKSVHGRNIPSHCFSPLYSGAGDKS